MTEPEETSAKYRAPALEKGLDVLELLAARGEPMGMVQIAAALNRSVSELFRMVQVLEHRGYVANTPTGDGLVLTNKLFSLGMTRAPAKSVLEAALPVMRRLSETIGQSCHLAVASAAEMVVVARIEAPGNQGFSVRVGYHRAIVEATSGLVLYAFQPEPSATSGAPGWSRRLAPAAWAAFEARAEKGPGRPARPGAQRRDPAGGRPLRADLRTRRRRRRPDLALCRDAHRDPWSDTIAAIRAAADEISVELGGQFQ
jgi:DNA-binding IclR family transcriptional regulator